MIQVERWRLPDLAESETHLPESGRTVVPETGEPEAEYDRGCRDGRLAADQEAVCELRIAASALVAAAEHIRNQRNEWVKELEDHVVVLALGVAREVIQREVREDPDIIRHRVAESFTEISWQSPTQVRLHAEDLTSVQAFFDGDGRSGRPDVLEWISDDTIERGDFVVVTPDRLVDGTLDTVLKAFHEHLADD